MKSPVDACSVRSRIEKLGVKRGQRVSIVGVADTDLDAEMARAGADFSFHVRKDSDFIFFGAEKEADLDKLADLAKSIQTAGAIWVVYPKSVKQITQAQVMAAMKAAGLVDVKVCSFSATHTALKAVIPVAQRGSR